MDDIIFRVVSAYLYGFIDSITDFNPPTRAKAATSVAEAKIVTAAI